jgi:hypothetical protein
VHAKGAIKINYWGCAYNQKKVSGRSVRKGEEKNDEMNENCPDNNRYAEHGKTESSYWNIGEYFANLRICAGEGGQCRKAFRGGGRNEAKQSM